MRCKCSVFILGFLLVFLGYDSFGQSISMTKTRISLGEDSITLVTYLKPGKNHVFIHVHENETTSLEMGLKMVEKYGGKLVTLEHSPTTNKNRNIRFKYQNIQYQIDPNRIFTRDTDVLKSNIKFGKKKDLVSDEVTAIVSSLADQIWEQIRGYDLIVALHNNKNVPASFKRHWIFWTKYEPDSYSILSYAKAFGNSNDSNQSCSQIYINPMFNNSEFFIVTQKSDFEMLSKAYCSVVLQNHNPIDDGSLSVFAAKNNRRYMNCEAKQGSTWEQEELLEVLIKTLYE